MTRTTAQDRAVGSVRDAMLTLAAVHGPRTTVAQAAEALGNPKVHMLLVTEDGRLLGTVVESDLAGASAPESPVIHVAKLTGRTVSPDDSLADVHVEMVRQGLRRLAVIDTDGRLLGLLCLKRHLAGFCSDQGVRERQRARHAEQQGVTLPIRSRNVS